MAMDKRVASACGAPMLLTLTLLLVTSKPTAVGARTPSAQEVANAENSNSPADRSGPTASSKTHVSTVVAKQGLPLPALTARGSSIRSVLMVSMGSGFCVTGRDDWRGELPRYLAAFLPKAATYVTSGRNRITSKCRVCHPDIRQSGENTTGDCSPFYSKRPDLTIVFGTGQVIEPAQPCVPGTPNWTACAQANYPSLGRMKAANLLRQRGREDATTVHFPVRKIPELFLNPFQVTHVVGDSSYFKPVAYDTAKTLSLCASLPKTHTIVYVARYTPHKGQVEFVQKLDPALLKNYTLHFYGGEDSSDYATKLKEEIKRTHLKAVVHGRVPHTELLEAVCQSSGQVHTALFDNNPRVAYEALFAGNPLLISKQSRTPDSLANLPFIRVTDLSKSPEAQTLNTDMAAFMELLEHRSWGQSISDYANSHMHSLAVYRRICEAIGVCAPAAHGDQARLLGVATSSSGARWRQSLKLRPHNASLIERSARRPNKQQIREG